MAAVTYFVRTVAREGKAEEAEETLLTNPAIAGEEPGRTVLALHRSVDDPNEFWIYETRESEEAVGTHESSEPFLKYRVTLRPLVEGESVVWGNTSPFAVNGYEAK
ncbi:MAG: putative quinol monooxygenase [Rubrobacter sp.]